MRTRKARVSYALSYMIEKKFRKTNWHKTFDLNILNDGQKYLFELLENFIMYRRIFFKLGLL